MPKVKYLVDLCSGQACTVHDLQDYEANVLVQLGVAENLDEVERIEAERVAAEKAHADRLEAERIYELIPPNILLNLNGRPVVGDYGDMIQQSEQQIVAEESKKKGSKASK